MHRALTLPFEVTLHFALVLYNGADAQDASQELELNRMLLETKHSFDIICVGGRDESEGLQVPIPIV